jgi:flagellar secretion chaperone FliS
MYQAAHDTYLESRVLAADPVELIAILYQSCTGAVRDARRHLAEGDIAARSRSIGRAQAILIELATSLDARGGEITARLSALYAYMQTRLAEANYRQADAPLGEVLALLVTLSEAWSGVGQQPQAAPREEPWQPAIAAGDAAPAASHDWSF